MPNFADNLTSAGAASGVSSDTIQVVLQFVDLFSDRFNRAVNTTDQGMFRMERNLQRMHGAISRLGNASDSMVRAHSAMATANRQMVQDVKVATNIAKRSFAEADKARQGALARAATNTGAAREHSARLAKAQADREAKRAEQQAARDRHEATRQARLDNERALSRGARLRPLPSDPGQFFEQFEQFASRDWRAQASETLARRYRGVAADRAGGTPNEHFSTALPTSATSGARPRESYNALVDRLREVDEGIEERQGMLADATERMRRGRRLVASYEAHSPEREAIARQFRAVRQQSAMSAREIGDRISQLVESGGLVEPTVSPTRGRPSGDAALFANALDKLQGREDTGARAEINRLIGMIREDVQVRTRMAPEEAGARYLENLRRMGEDIQDLRFPENVKPHLRAGLAPDEPTSVAIQRTMGVMQPAGGQYGMGFDDLVRGIDAMERNTNEVAEHTRHLSALRQQSTDLNQRVDEAANAAAEADALADQHQRSAIEAADRRGEQRNKLIREYGFSDSDDVLRDMSRRFDSYGGELDALNKKLEASAVTQEYYDRRRGEILDDIMQPMGGYAAHQADVDARIEEFQRAAQQRGTDAIDTEASNRRLAETTKAFQDSEKAVKHIVDAAPRPANQYAPVFKRVAAMHKQYADLLEARRADILPGNQRRQTLQETIKNNQRALVEQLPWRSGDAQVRRAVDTMDQIRNEAVELARLQNRSLTTNEDVRSEIRATKDRMSGMLDVMRGYVSKEDVSAVRRGTQQLVDAEREYQYGEFLRGRAGPSPADQAIESQRLTQLHRIMDKKDEIILKTLRPDEKGTFQPWMQRTGGTFPSDAYTYRHTPGQDNPFIRDMIRTTRANAYMGPSIEKDLTELRGMFSTLGRLNEAFVDNQHQIQKHTKLFGESTSIMADANRRRMEANRALDDHKFDPLIDHQDLQQERKQLLEENKQAAQEISGIATAQAAHRPNIMPLMEEWDEVLKAFDKLSKAQLAQSKAQSDIRKVEHDLSQEDARRKSAQAEVDAARYAVQGRRTDMLSMDSIQREAQKLATASGGDAANWHDFEVAARDRLTKAIGEDPELAGAQARLQRAETRKADTDFFYDNLVAQRMQAANQHLMSANLRVDDAERRMATAQHGVAELRKLIKEQPDFFSDMQRRSFEEADERFKHALGDVGAEQQRQEEEEERRARRNIERREQAEAARQARETRRGFRQAQIPRAGVSQYQKMYEQQLQGINRVLRERLADEKITLRMTEAENAARQAHNNRMNNLIGPGLEQARQDSFDLWQKENAEAYQRVEREQRAKNNLLTAREDLTRALKGEQQQVTWETSDRRRRQHLRRTRPYTYGRRAPSDMGPVERMQRDAEQRARAMQAEMDRLRPALDRGDAGAQHRYEMYERQRGRFTRYAEAQAPAVEKERIEIAKEAKFQQQQKDMLRSWDAQAATRLTRTLSGLIGLTAILTTVGMGVGMVMQLMIDKISEWHQRNVQAKQGVKAATLALLEEEYRIKSLTGAKEKLNKVMDKSARIALTQLSINQRAQIASMDENQLRNMDWAATVLQKSVPGMDADKAHLAVQQFLTGDAKTAIESIGVGNIPGQFRDSLLDPRATQQQQVRTFWAMMDDIHNKLIAQGQHIGVEGEGRESVQLTGAALSDAIAALNSEDLFGNLSKLGQDVAKVLSGELGPDGTRRLAAQLMRTRGEIDEALLEASRFVDGQGRRLGVENLDANNRAAFEMLSSLGELIRAGDIDYGQATSTAELYSLVEGQREVPDILRRIEALLKGEETPVQPTMPTGVVLEGPRIGSEHPDDLALAGRGVREASRFTPFTPYAPDVSSYVVAGREFGSRDDYEQFVRDASRQSPAFDSLGSINDMIWNNILLGAGSRVRGRHTGGMIGAGETTLVGERGPELIRAPGGSRVTPNGQLPNIPATVAAPKPDAVASMWAAVERIAGRGSRDLVNVTADYQYENERQWHAGTANVNRVLHQGMSMMLIAKRDAYINATDMNTTDAVESDAESFLLALDTMMTDAQKRIIGSWWWTTGRTDLMTLELGDRDKQFLTTLSSLTEDAEVDVTSSWWWTTGRRSLGDLSDAGVELDDGKNMMMTKVFDLTGSVETAVMLTWWWHTGRRSLGDITEAGIELDNGAVGFTIKLFSMMDVVKQNVEGSWWWTSGKTEIGNLAPTTEQFNVTMPEAIAAVQSFLGLTEGSVVESWWWVTGKRSVGDLAPTTEKLNLTMPEALAALQTFLGLTESGVVESWWWITGKSDLGDLMPSVEKMGETTPGVLEALQEFLGLTESNVTESWWWVTGKKDLGDVTKAQTTLDVSYGELLSRLRTWLDRIKAQITSSWWWRIGRKGGGTPSGGGGGSPTPPSTGGNPIDPGKPPVKPTPPAEHRHTGNNGAYSYNIKHSHGPGQHPHGFEKQRSPSETNQAPPIITPPGQPVVTPPKQPVVPPPGQPIPPVLPFERGGTRLQNGWSWIGERGPELMYLPSGAQVRPLSSNERGVSSIGGGQPIRLEVPIYIGGRRVERAILDIVNNEVRIREPGMAQ